MSTYLAGFGFKTCFVPLESLVSPFSSSQVGPRSARNCEAKSQTAKMSKVGILPVPAGETADFDGFSELQVRILVVYIVTSVLATIGLILRFYTGACLNQRRLGLDACTSALFFLFYTGHTPNVQDPHVRATIAVKYLDYFVYWLELTVTIQFSSSHHGQSTCPRSLACSTSSLVASGSICGASLRSSCNAI